MMAKRIPEPPSRWRRFTAVGPGFLWMVSAAGFGELLFTPRLGALYGYPTGEPVDLLKIAGSIEAVHIPIVAGLGLYMNRRVLPRELRPSPITIWMTVAAGAFSPSLRCFTSTTCSGAKISG